MVDNQTTIFEMLYPTFKITKPIRTIELFGGYGSQLLSLKYLNANVEQHKLCEWAVKSIQAYKDLHCENDNTDYSKELSLEEIKKYLFNKGISSNYNDPMTKEQVNRLNEKQARTIYNNIQATHNLVNIQQVKGEDLEITNTDKYCYIMTYSFPCQDLSLAGKGKGMKDTTTRSGLLWEVERILTECKELGTLPQVLLMENVPQVHGADNVEHFNRWQLRLEELGYKNYWKDLIATDYGIPQTRNRTFMVSILGEYNYTFPKPIPLKLKLKYMLEDNVDEKYFLSDRMKQYIFSEDDKYKVNKNSLKLDREIACSKTTREGNTRADTTDYICDELPENTNLLHLKEPMILDDRDIGINGINITDVCPTQRATRNGLKVLEPLKIKNATKQGYLEATDGDGIDISSRMEHHRGTIQKDKIQTLTTQCDRGVVIKPKVLGGIGEKDSNNNTQWKQQNRVYDENIAISITTSFNPYYKNDLRIRRLTPKECFRLMGIKDEDFEKIAKNQSDSSLYHLAGDSIVCQGVLTSIFKEMLIGDD